MALDLLSLLTAVPGLISDFNKSTSDPYQKQQEDVANRMSQISAAQTDTSNPLYKQLYGQYADQNRQNMASVIAEAQGQNRMNTNMGRTPLFDPSRGGETMFRSLMQQQQGAGLQADQQTRQALQGALNGANSTGNYYNQISPMTARGNSQQLAGYQGISDLLRSGMTPNTTQQTGTQASPYASLYSNTNQQTDPSVAFASQGYGGY